MANFRNGVHHSPSALVRAAAWAGGHPAELERAADEWAALGFSAYAEYLRAWARGEPPAKVMRSPW